MCNGYKLVTCGKRNAKWQISIGDVWPWKYTLEDKNNNISYLFWLDWKNVKDWQYIQGGEMATLFTVDCSTVVLGRYFGRIYQNLKYAYSLTRQIHH